MLYNPAIHHRRSIRLKGYDYSQSGLYFVTICCQDMTCRFGEIENGEMILNDYGKFAHTEWEKLSERYPNVLLDAFQIMPNHIHGIIVLNTVGATLAVALNNDTIAPIIRAGASPAPTAAATTTIGNIVGAYKSLVMNKCLNICKIRNEYLGRFWQRNYYEHIIRNDNSYQRIADYIISNPAKWETDKFYSEKIKQT